MGDPSYSRPPSLPPYRVNACLDMDGAGLSPPRIVPVDAGNHPAIVVHMGIVQGEALLPISLPDIIHPIREVNLS